MPIANSAISTVIERRESGVLGIDASVFPAEEKENRPENVAEQGRGEEQRERSARREFLRAKANSEVSSAYVRIRTSTGGGASCVGVI